MSKLSRIELSVKYHTPPSINFAYQKTVSYSQYSIYAQCPYRWHKQYVLKLAPYTDTINTIFGTSIHETIQHYLTIMYEESGLHADTNINLEEYFETRLRENYQKAYDSNQSHVSSADEMREFYDDGIEILKWFKQNRNKYFKKSGYSLLGVELPLLINIHGNFFLKGFIDIVLYDSSADKVYIYDLKTSRASWSDKQKKDELKSAQLLLYKEYFAKQYNFDIDKIEVEFLVLKRKIWENCSFPQGRIQSHIPPSGKNKRSQAKENLEKFIIDCFDDNGKPLEKEHIKIPSKDNCKYCPFDKTINCVK